MQRPAQPDGVLPIVRLVREKVDASEWSLRTYAKMRGVAYSTLRRYYDKNLPALSQPPRRETLRELALALDVPLGEVEQAALESLSYRAAPGRVEPSTTTAKPATVEEIYDAIDRNGDLLPEAKNHLKSQIGLLLRIQGGPSLRKVPDVVAEEAAALASAEQTLAEVSDVGDCVALPPGPRGTRRK